MYGSVAKLGGRQLFPQLVIPDPAISYFTEPRTLQLDSPKPRAYTVSKCI